MGVKKFTYLILFLMFAGLMGCSETPENKNEEIPSEKKEVESSAYEEKVIDFEEGQAFGPYDMRGNEDGNVEYVSLIQEQQTKKMKTQSYSNIHDGENWLSEKTNWGMVLKKEFEKTLGKEYDLKNSIFNTSLTFGADTKLYVMYNLYHPDAGLEEKGLDYEYIVANFLFRVDISTNSVESIKIPEATAAEDGKGVNSLKCSAFADGKLLIQDGDSTYVYDVASGEKVCEAQDVVNADGYVAGDGVFYSALVDSDNNFIVCQYDENSGKLNNKFKLETYDAEAMRDRTKFMLKVYEYDLYVACKEGIYRLGETDDAFEKVVDGVKDNLLVMGNQDEHIYDFAVLGDEKFAIDYRRLFQDETDIESYEQESLIYYVKSDSDAKEE